ncbi:hypothetical protein [Myxococcus sp. SDU36]|nr:hypothetical protein [Myxococcus sp. SDU36]
MRIRITGNFLRGGSCTRRRVIDARCGDNGCFRVSGNRACYR